MYADIFYMLNTLLAGAAGDPEQLKLAHMVECVQKGSIRKKTDNSTFLLRWLPILAPRKMKFPPLEFAFIFQLMEASFEQSATNENELSNCNHFAYATN